MSKHERGAFDVGNPDKNYELVKKTVIINSYKVNAIKGIVCRKSARCRWINLLRIHVSDLPYHYTV